MHTAVIENQTLCNLFLTLQPSYTDNSTPRALERCRDCNDASTCISLFGILFLEKLETCSPNTQIEPIALLSNFSILPVTDIPSMLAEIPFPQRWKQRVTHFFW